MLNGLIKPDRGRITMRGRIGALIALGAGFNPILTGRENIYINGSVLGLSKREIDRKVEEIIDFAEVRDSIDAPVRTFSSGMTVRLGFAIATAITKPDILLLDEVLAVGDAQFRYKCYNRVGQLKRDTAVIFVSHSMAHIGAICDRALVLEKGRVDFLGHTSGGIQRYMENARSSSGHDRDEAFNQLGHPVSRFDLTLSQDPVSYGSKITLSAGDRVNRIDAGIASQDRAIRRSRHGRCGMAQQKIAPADQPWAGDESPANLPGAALAQEWPLFHRFRPQ